ncbi:MAG TPA: DUF5686 and carboxypeptidase regulatory-like domain-containing protein [Bacteroidia bacterium]|nr:DUF5686 and carboxypeptidase regulatory-like domain-containing protein [Bacteroidia bacterium]
MRSRNFLFLLLVLPVFGLFAQTFVLSGKVTDDKKEVLPFASVFVKGTTIGTNSNADGFYTLKLERGQYEIVFQYVGYKREIRSVMVEADAVINIMLPADSYELKEVTVKAGEDPAYPIIRQAIKKRKYYLGQINSYSCRAYIKGLQRLKDFPKNFGALLKVTNNGEKLDSSMLGVIYLSESESKYHFRKPNDEKEIMFSSKVSGDNKAFSFNQLSDMKFNFYENLVYIDGLSDRPFISPINENAFLSYKYRLLGTVTEDGRTVNKILVIPKRKTDPCFHGIIYIQDNTWRIHSADMYLTKDAKIDFVDTLKIRQLHAPVKGDSIWMPIAMNFGFYFKFLGFKGDGYYNAVISDYDVNPTFPKKFFKNEVLKVEDEANKKDTAYWKENRPIPLTTEEVTDYHKKDSLSKLKNSKPYKDSIDRRANKFKIGSLLMGYKYQNSFKKINFSTTGIVNSGVQYNTVEGVNSSMNLNFEKEYEDFRRHEINAGARYGFSNYLWGGYFKWQYTQKPERFQYFTFNAQSMVQQFNPANPIPPFINTLYTLFSNDNYMKLYRKSSVQLSYRRELVNGLMFYANAEYAERQALRNTSPYLIIDDKNKLFTSNDPLNPSTDEYGFKTNNAFVLDATFRIRFKQKYYTVPHRKIITGSKYPNIFISYKKAIPVLGSVADYDLAMASIEDDIRIGLLGTFAYRLKGGYFLNNNTMYFMDYKHFNGNQTILANSDYLNSFKLLPYYMYSTNQYFVEAHAEHHFNGFIFNKIPLLKKTKMQEVVGAHFLYNDKINQYYEINFAIENIFRVIRFDYVLGYGVTNKVNSGFLIGIGTNF